MAHADDCMSLLLVMAAFSTNFLANSNSKFCFSKALVAMLSLLWYLHINISSSLLAPSKGNNCSLRLLLSEKLSGGADGCGSSLNGSGGGSETNNPPEVDYQESGN